MLSQGFTVCLSSLELLQPGEKGIVTRFLNTDEQTIKKIMALGITPGTAITLEQRFPSFIIKVGNYRLSVDKTMARTIGVRLTP